MIDSGGFPAWQAHDGNATDTMSSPRLRPPNRLYDAYLIDLDGTVYRGERLLPGAGETLQRLRGMGRRLVFLTNEAARRREDFVEKLAGMGVRADREEILSSTMALVAFLNETLPGGRLFVIGASSLHRELAEAGFELSEAPGRIQAVIASNDYEFDYRKLRIAYEAIQEGAALYATNPDRTAPLAGGGEAPDTGPIIAAIEAASNHPLDAMVGKPSGAMAKAALRLAGVPVAGCLLVGDNLETDIRMGVENGIPTALVLGGVTSASALKGASIQPDFVLGSLIDLIAPGSDWEAQERSPSGQGAQA
ncbi:MAG: HAD-IIA family hydrolase [Anaerolineales bacterium]|nr:HAD-IIA family hydrolase [Anaerolineales bacterium]